MTKRIMLIVDDEEINLGLLTAIFEYEFTVKTAKDGLTALDTLGFYGARTSIVLLDLVMSGMDGFEVLNKMRENAELQTIPVIVVSGQDELEAAIAATKLGAADFISKPVDPEWIKMKVEAAINRADSARLRAENEYILLQSAKEAKYRTVLDSTGTVVIEYDRLNGTFQYDSSISKHIAGNFDGRKLWEILTSDMVADASDVKTMQAIVYKVSNNHGTGSNSMTIQLKTPSGNREWFRMQVFMQPGQTERAGTMILTFNNINDEIIKNDKLRFQAERDTLTGLYNRAMFFKKAAGMIAAHEPGFYVMSCFDIDKFKVINDQYGSEKGDEILKNIANVFDEGFTAIGGICSRIMADDFAVLYPSSLIDSDALAEIRRKITMPDGDLPTLSYSVGRFLVDDLTLPVSGVYDRALLAQADARGRFGYSVVTYDESMRERLIREQHVTGEMRNALVTGQFEVWYQPQYNHASGALIGSEALVRWRSPKDGSLIPPIDFIPVFERNGFIYELDQYVWEKTCSLLRRWIDDGQSPLPISVNISRYDLLQESFLSTLIGLVERYNLPLDLLRVEITESAFSKNTNRIVRIVKSLIDYGFTVEIDDFGSGYSSLNTLKDVPAQILKLDMRFLESGEDSDRGGNVLESVVRMAKWLGMAVIAEGVETIEQADYLKSIGCVYVQGYLYEKPMPVHEYEALCKRDVGADSISARKLLALETVKNLNNNAFWNPKSMDTLIFNSYVGAANIVEYHNGEVELLRVSEKFVQLFGSESMSFKDVINLDWTKYFEKESLKAYREAVAHSIETGDEATVECVFIDIPGCPERMYLRVTLRVIAAAGERYLVYCLAENITEQREIKEKEQEANELLRAIIANMSGGVNISVIRDGAPMVQVANRQYYETRGYTQEQYEKEVTHLSQIVHPDDQEMMFRATSTAVKPFSIVYRIVRRDGYVRWIMNNVTFVNLPGFNEPVQLSVTNDITEIREAEDKERANTQQLQAIMNNINGGVAMAVMRDGFPKTIFANEQFYQQRGYTKEQYDSESFDARKVFHKDDLKRVTEMAQTARGPHSIIYRIVRQDGEVRWLQNNITEVKMPGYDEIVKLSVSNDITELRQAERKEHEVSERLQAILGALNSGVSGITVSNDGCMQYVFANDRYYSMLGYTKEQFETEVGNALNLIHPSDRKRIDAQLAELIKTGGNTVFEYRVIKRDGAIAHLRVNASMLSLDFVPVPVSLGVSTDVTDMVMARQQISALSERMQAVLENVDNGITAIKAGHLNDGFIFANNRFFELYGYTKEQYESEVGALTDLIHPLDKPIVLKTAAEMNEIGMKKMLEHRIIRRDGETRWLRANICVRGLADVDGPVQFVVYSDITQEKLAREKVQAINDELQFLNAKIVNDRETLQTMMDDMPGGFARLRVLPGGNVVTEYVNDNYCRMVGMSREEILSEDGQDAMDMTHPDDKELVRSTVVDMVETGVTRSIKYRLRHADGSYIPFSVFGRVTTGLDGAKYINVYYAELSEQEKKEQIIRETVPFVLSAILASSTNLAFAKDMDLRYICASSEFVRMTNYTCVDDIIGKTDYEIFPKKVADTLHGNDMKVLETNLPLLDYVQALPTADGVLRYYKLSKYILRDTYGNMLGIYGIGRDITEDKSAYAQLKLLVDSIPGGIASYVASDRGIRITYFNDGFCNIMGYTHDEYEKISATGITNITFKEDVPLVMNCVQDLLHNNTPLDCTFRVHTKSGGYKWVNLKGGITERYGDVCQINAVLVDVTERVEAENALSSWS